MGVFIVMSPCSLVAWRWCSSSVDMMRKVVYRLPCFCMRVEMWQGVVGLHYR